jgi:hypothetical protein
MTELELLRQIRAATAKMRDSQRDYFASHHSAALGAAKKAEKELDVLLNKYADLYLPTAPQTPNLFAK